jgi:hypothetical protein
VASSLDLSLILSPGLTFALGGLSLICDAPIALSLASSSDGAVLDAQERSRHFVLRNGCRLGLQRLSLINVYHAQDGGAISASSATRYLQDTTIANCVARFGGGVYANANSTVLVVRSTIWSARQRWCDVLPSAVRQPGSPARSPPLPDHVPHVGIRSPNHIPRLATHAHPRRVAAGFTWIPRASR